MDDDIQLFPCYSLKLREFLTSNGLRYKLIGLNPNSKLMFWVYVKDMKLNKCLKKWKETALK